MRCQSLEPVIEFYERMAQDYDKQYETPYWKLYHEITWENLRRFLPKRRGADPKSQIGNVQFSNFGFTEDRRLVDSRQTNV